MKAMRLLIPSLVLLVAACGYHAPGTSDAWVGEDARLMYVALFDNRTSEPYLENYLTDALVAELSRSRLMTLTENRAAAEVVLAGAVESFSSSARAYSSSDTITDYRATMGITVQLVRSDDSTVLWKGSLSRSEDYLATANKNLQLEGERLAAQEVAKRLAEDVRARLTNNF